jgi:magnesium transporter
MINRYKIKDHQITAVEDETPDIWVVTNPSADEKEWLAVNLALDEHSLAPALDPEEPARLEFEPGCVELIIKHPRNYSSKDDLLFKVSSLGLFLFKDKLVLAHSGDVNMFPGKYFKQVADVREVFLKLICGSVSHFVEHLKVIGMIAEELKHKIASAAESKHLQNLATLKKSLAYYLSAIKANAGVIDALKLNAEKPALSLGNLKFLEDIAAENVQCMLQAEACSGVLASLADAR